jgi:DNA-binding helix-hairpin-helix protein with protein kinase domain
MTMETTINVPGLIIDRKIAEGGQGEVFAVRENGKPLALKLYFEKNATPEQRQIIEELIQSGPPKTRNPNSFIWPMKLVELPGDKRFGYLMPLIDMRRYITLAHIESGRVRHPGYETLIRYCCCLAECFRDLHIEGYCYRDISKYNVMFSPETGDVVICDNDNVVVNKHGPGQISGTTQFMAPEVILRKARPSTATDHHSLGILLFMTLFGGNPFHGIMEHGIHIFDGNAAEYLYGHKPVFVFDPHDASNRLPDLPGYRHVKTQWMIFPEDVRSLFIRAFTSGIRNPADRVTDVEWVSAFTKLLGRRHVCTCGAENFWEPARKDQRRCWNKGCKVDYPGKLVIGDRSSVLIKSGQQITSLHFGEKAASKPVGEIVPHPSAASTFVLRNTTGEPWLAGTGSKQVEIPAGKGIALRPGIRIKAMQQELAVYP